MKYFYANGGIHPFEQSEEGLTLPQWALQYSGDEGSDFRILGEDETDEYVRQQAIQQNGFDMSAARWAGNEQAMVVNPATGQVELIVNTPQGPMLTSQADAAGIAGTPLMKPAEESTLSQFTDFGGTLAQLAAMAAGSYGVGSLLGGGLAGAGELGATVADGIGASDVASYVVPEAVEMGAGQGLQVGNLPNWTELADMTVQNAGSGGLAAGGNVGGLGLTTGAGAGLTSLADLAAGGLGAGLATGGLGLGGVTAGLAGGTGATAADYYAAQAADDAAAGANATGVPAPAGTGALGNVYGTAGQAAAGTALSRILNGTGTTADWASVLGNVAGAGLGAYASNQQAGKLEELAGKYFDLGAPSRARYEASMTSGFDPSTIPGYQGAVDNSMNAMLRKLSTQGNPFGNPGGLIEANKAVVAGTALPALQAYQGANAASGGFGTYNSAAPGAAQASLGANNNFYNAIGGGIANLTNPRSSLEDLLKRYSGGSTALA